MAATALDAACPSTTTFSSFYISLIVAFIVSLNSPEFALLNKKFIFKSSFVIFIMGILLSNLFKYSLVFIISSKTKAMLF